MGHQSSISHLLVAYNHIMNVMVEISKNIKTMIDTSGKNLTKIALEIGVARQTVSRYYAGKKFPSFDTLIKLCRALDCTYEDILGPL